MKNFENSISVKRTCWISNRLSNIDWPQNHETHRKRITQTLDAWINSSIKTSVSINWETIKWSEGRENRKKSKENSNNNNEWIRYYFLRSIEIKKKKKIIINRSDGYVWKVLNQTFWAHFSLSLSRSICSEEEIAKVKKKPINESIHKLDLQSLRGHRKRSEKFSFFFFDVILLPNHQKQNHQKSFGQIFFPINRLLNFESTSLLLVFFWGQVRTNFFFFVLIDWSREIFGSKIFD